MSERNRFDPNMKIEFQYNLGATLDECANCREEFTTRAGFIPIERGTVNPVCDGCVGVDDLALDFDALARFFDDWCNQPAQSFEYWRFTGGCFLAGAANGIEKPFPAETVRQMAKLGAPVETAALPSRTSRQILDETNELARRFYAIHDRGGTVEKGYRFDLFDHPQEEEQCWRMATEAQLFLTETDLRDVISDLDE